MPLKILRQDITLMEVDAIVNTTNEEMVGYSGIDFAVHKKAGKGLDDECRSIAPLGLGEAKLTKGYNLPARYVIHTSGPVWQGGLCGESIILKSCYLESLKLAAAYKLKSVAFPLISSGAYGYPKDKVLRFAVDIISEFLFDHELDVYLCVFDRASYEFSKTLFREISDFIESTEDEYSDYSELSASVCSVRAPSPDFVESSCSIFKSKRNEVCSKESASESLLDYMKNMDKPFAYKLFEFIDERGMTDVECYKKANVDKKTFSKIKCHPDTYKPSKQTAVAFAIALRLDLDETQELLATAGLTLSKSFTFDKIIRYFIHKGIYDIFEINEALFEFDQVLLGC